MAADGHAYPNRVNNFSHSEVAKVVVDAVLSSPTYWARLNGMGKNFDEPTKKFDLKIAKTNLGQTFKGLEVLNSSAADTTIQLEFNHTGYTHPAVKVMLEHMANEGKGEDINLADYIDAEAIAEINEDLGSLIFGVGSGDNPNGLEKIVDDGTNSDTIGGQSRTTYTDLKSTVTASGGTLSLAKMATLHSAITSGVRKPTLILTTEAIWDLFESLLQPTVRASYSEVGYSKLALRGKNAMASNSELKGGAGFNALSYRGIPVIADEFAPSGVMYMLNENYIKWFGRKRVPSDFKGDLEAVNLGKSTSTIDMPMKPSDFHGWFYQKEQMMPHQAGRIGRYYVVGQVAGYNPKTSGKLTGIDSV